MIKVKNILVTTDLSHASHSAMEYAQWLAQKEKASISILYCVDNIPIIAYHTVDLTYDKFRSQILEEELKKLNHFCSIFQKQYKRKIHPVLLEGNAAQTIVRYARQNAFDIIVMSTHGRTGIQHALMGSVTEKVVRTAHCPVLTVKSAKIEKIKKTIKKRQK